MKILVTGSRGLIGSALVPALEKDGHDVIRLVHSLSPIRSTMILWNPESESIIDSYRLDGLDAVIHLAGENIAAGRWTPEKKARIRNSRVMGTTLLARTLAEQERKPGIFISASAVGYYGHRGDEVLTEESELGSGFLAGVCRDWEAATEIAARSGVRVAIPRIGVMISPTGGILETMMKPFNYNLGGIIGNGRQYMSWITIHDTVRAIQFILKTDTFSGPINLTSPRPVTNAEFTETLGHVLKRRTPLRIPAFLVKKFFGEFADETMLASTQAIPKKLIDHGFTFDNPELEEALAAQLRENG